MLFGRKPRLVGDALLNISLAYSIPATSFSRSYLRNLQLVHQLCRERLVRERMKFKEVYDRKHRVLTSLEEGDVVLLQNLQPSSKIDNRWCESPYVVLNRPDINVPVFDIKELSTGLIKTSHRNQLLLLFQTEGVVEPHLVKKKHITEAVSDHVSDPNDHIDTSVVSASHTSTLSWLQDSYHLTWILTVPTQVTQNHTPLVVHPTSNHMISETLSDSEDNISSLLGKSTAEKLGVLKLLVNSLSSDSIENKYPQIISNSLGKLKNHNIKLHIDHSIPPVARKHYIILFHLRSKVKDEIKRLLKNDIIEPVDNKCPTDWISPVIIVPKHNSSDIRICIDMRSANEAIKRTRHVTPTVDEIIASVNNCKVFSKIDLTMGYHQLQLDPECRNITTFSTHLGLYRYKRLAFGINSAAEIFQYTIASLINDIKGVKNISDDIIVYGEDKKSHDLSLNKVSQRLNDNGLTINLLKCKFSVSEIEFFGFKFSEHGLSADPKKVEAVKSFPKPEDAKALRSFIGMATYSSRFIKNYSIITAFLRELLKKGVKWNWTVNHDKAFQKLKSELSSETIMSYCDPNKPTTVMVDGSPVGLGAILVQDNRTIAYGIRALTPTESRYSQIEREALSVVFGCEHFHIYLAGCEFEIITDHKPLLYVWKKINPPLRISEG